MYKYVCITLLSYPVYSKDIYIVWYDRVSDGNISFPKNDKNKICINNINLQKI